MRHLLARAVEKVASVVYGLGVRLFNLSDRIDGWHGTVAPDPPTLTWSDWHAGSTNASAATETKIRWIQNP